MVATRFRSAALTDSGKPPSVIEAAAICQKTLDNYEAPALDDAIRAELEEYVTRRRAELGD
jgi:trimethylamine--corrinoid protein Co-methyltransferase